jgi:hypothetical protein
MDPADVPDELVKAASKGWWKASGEGLEWEDWLRVELAAVLPLHERQVRERLGLRDEWGVLFRLPDGSTDAEGELADEGTARQSAERARRGLRDGVTAHAACRQVTEWRIAKGADDA